MIREQGIVKKILNDEVEIEVDRRSACGKCKANCRLSAGGDKMIIAVKAITGIKEGDRVIIEIPEDLILKGAFVAYGLPTAFFLLGFLLAKLIFKLADMRALLVAIFTLSLSYPIARLYGERRKDSLRGRIKEIIR